MDRNKQLVDKGSKLCGVALRKESVDRNTTTITICIALKKSLSARRAWIEILIDDVSTGGKIVALRKESVDRNLWWGVRKAVGSLVALRKESVDRNIVRSGGRK